MSLFHTKKKVVLGFDLGNLTSQISYYEFSMEDPESITTVAGEEQFNIPTVLCKRYGINQWSFGREAQKNSKQKEGFLVEDLIGLARREEEVIIDETSFLPADLIILFVKRVLSLCNMTIALEEVTALMFTVEVLDKGMIQILEAVRENLPVNSDAVFYQTHEESFYQYMIHQPKVLWQQQVGVLDFTENNLKTYRLELNYKTAPIVSFIETIQYKKMQRSRLLSEVAEDLLDIELLEIAGKLCEGRLISSVYLIGDALAGGWNTKTIQFLCKNRRVFQGNNMYSKGACYALKEKYDPGVLSEKFIFLGRDIVKSNIGIRALRNGTEAYIALIDAGVRWFDAKKECDFIIETGNIISFVITPLNGRDIKIAEISLTGFPTRPRRASRVRVGIGFLAEDNAYITIKDMGFGELYPATDLEWMEEFKI